LYDHDRPIRRQCSKIRNDTGLVDMTDRSEAIAAVHPRYKVPGLATVH
jgi:hypothetical protein